MVHQRRQSTFTRENRPRWLQFWAPNWGRNFRSEPHTLGTILHNPIAISTAKWLLVWASWASSFGLARRLLIGSKKMSENSIFCKNTDGYGQARRMQRRKSPSILLRPIKKVHKCWNYFNGDWRKKRHCAKGNGFWRVRFFFGSADQCMSVDCLEVRLFAMKHSCARSLPLSSGACKRERRWVWTMRTGRNS